MTDAEFYPLLQEAVAATGLDRYRWLCSEANTLPPPNSRDDWRRFIVERRWVPSPSPSPTPVDPDYLSRLPPLGGCCGGGGGG